jgi:hypothetical protein
VAADHSSRQEARSRGRMSFAQDHETSSKRKLSEQEPIRGPNTVQGARASDPSGDMVEDKNKRARSDFEQEEQREEKTTQNEEEIPRSAMKTGNKLGLIGSFVMCPSVG